MGRQVLLIAREIYDCWGYSMVLLSEKEEALELRLPQSWPIMVWPLWLGCKPHLRAPRQKVRGMGEFRSHTVPKPHPFPGRGPPWGAHRVLAACGSRLD